MLQTSRFALRSDQTWETSFAGSAWRHATLATKPRMSGPGNSIAGGERTSAALAAIWPIWVGLGICSMVIWLAGRWWFGRTRTPGAIAGLSRREATVLLLIVAALWLALFGNNTRSLPTSVGFDASAHVDYIEYIQKHRALPLPNEGWEMYQPPLYYAISAALLSLFDLSVTDAAAGTVLRSLTMFLGIIHFTLVFLSLRLLFPGQSGRQLVGLLLAAFLPMQLYLSHYVTNETLAATLATAAIFLCLRLLRTESASVAGYAGLGFCLGAAMLTKTTGLLLVPFIIVAVAVRPAGQKSPLAVRLRNLGATLTVCFAACGWYYLWIWHHFGKPLIGNWDTASGFSWWQDNGYHTAADFTRFGRALVNPLYSAFAGFADGIYSTLWGDGLCGGIPSLNYPVPWNYDLMIAGYLLALLPTLMILTGAAVSLRHFIRKPSSEWFVLLGLSGTVVVAMVFMNLKVPSCAQAKAFYGLCALVPLCSFGAAGWEILTRGRKWLQFALGTMLLVWAMNSFASLWIRGGSASTHVYLGVMLDFDDRPEAARSEFIRAVGADPSNAQARQFLANSLDAAKQTDEALQEAGRAVELDPANPVCHRALSTILAGRGRLEEALAEARRAVELGPENLPALRLLSDYLFRLGRDEEAATAARNSLAVFPYDASLHYKLGQILARKNGPAAATNQYEYALMFKPDWVEARLTYGQALLSLGDAANGLRQFQETVWLAPHSLTALNRLAWLLATHPKAEVRNGPVAVELAEQTCAMTDRRDPVSLNTLAAGYAEAHRFPEAIGAAQEALALARMAGDESMVARAENLLKGFQSGQPFREDPRLPP